MCIVNFIYFYILYFFFFINIRSEEWIYSEVDFLGFGYVRLVNILVFIV